MRAVIYARFSSSNQRDESIEGQLRECHAFALSKGLVVVGEYIDRAFSATTDQRPDFQRMIRDSAKREWECVICWKHDRFARNRYDAAFYKAKLKENGVSILYAKEDVPEGPQGIIIDSIMEGFAEYYSANLSENVKRGLYESALKRQTMGVMVYGYSEKDRHYVPNEDAPIVKRVFEEYASGKSSKEIYSRLNDEGLRLRGHPFGKNSVPRIIQNPKYKGEYSYKDIFDPHGVPAIVSEDLWEKANNMLGKRKDAPARKYEAFLLTGKLFCGHCGEPMTAGGGTGKSGKRYGYYVCNGRRQGKCKKQNVPKKIEDVVIKQLKALVFDDSFIDRVSDYYIEWQKQTDETAVKESELKRVERSLANLQRSQEVGFSETIAKRILELESEQKELAFALAHEPTFTKEQVVAFLRAFREGDIGSEKWKAFLVRAFVRKIYVFDDRLIIQLNINGEGEEITCSDLELFAPPSGADSKILYWKGSVLAIIKGLG